MSVEPASLQAAFDRARTAGFSHALLSVDWGDVPRHARVVSWTVVPATGGTPGEMVALYDLRDAAAPRLCLQPQLLKTLRDSFASALVLPELSQQQGTARIVARPATLDPRYRL